MARRYVEERHEAKLATRVIDVRPAGTQYAEWLTQRFNLAMVVIPLLLLAGLIPVMAPLLLIVVAIHLVAHTTTKPQLPFRYPACNPEPDHKGKDGTGILLFGNVDSDSEYDHFKEIWLSDDDLRKHMLIIGSTGSGKSETLKGIFFNALCWSSGYFVADGKADNTLPTDSFTEVRSFGRDDSLLFLNFLLGGKTPEQVRKSRRRRTNKINPVSSADADTIIQMGANMLPKVEGEGKNWQEKALNLWRAVIQALCYMRDTDGVDLSVATIIDHLALPMIEQLYVKGYEESQIRGEWSYGFAGIKSYLESGCPAYKVDKLLAKHGYGDAPAPAAGGRPAAGGKAFEQDSMAYEQHAYRTTQLMPVLNLLDKTYGFIFRDKYPEIDMIDITLNNRILVMLIPSLEKSSQEAENLGKLAIACLRVMMGKNLGADIEGNRRELLESKATNAPYPYLVALDELAYYFSDGIAVMFAQARSLGMCMIAAAQDLEKLTEGNRAAEAGAMLANQVTKLFMRIDDANKTYEFMKKILGEISIAVRRTFEIANAGYKRSQEIDVTNVERVPLKELQSKNPGEGAFNSNGRTVRALSFYVGQDLKDHRNDEFFVLRFLQVEPPSDEEIDAHSIPVDAADDATERGSRMLEILKHQRSRTGQQPPLDAVISAVAITAKTIGAYTKAPERGIALYVAAKRALVGVAADEPDGIGEGRQSTRVSTADLQTGHRPINETFTSIDSDPAISAAFTPAQGDDEGVDPLAFLDGGAPFERKPAELLLGNAERAVLVEEAGAQAEAHAPDAVDVLESFMGAGKTMNLRRANPDADFSASEDATAEAISLAAGISPTALFNGGPKAAAKAAPSSMPTANLSRESTSWVTEALVAAGASLTAKQQDGRTVVGFSSATMDHVAQIEEVLGNPAPKLAAQRLEVVVSDQVTPDADPAGEGLNTLDDINDLFNTLQRSTSKD